MKWFIWWLVLILCACSNPAVPTTTGVKPAALVGNLAAATVPTAPPMGQACFDGKRYTPVGKKGCEDVVILGARMLSLYTRRGCEVALVLVENETVVALPKDVACVPVGTMMSWDGTGVFVQYDGKTYTMVLDAQGNVIR